MDEGRVQKVMVKRRFIEFLIDKGIYDYYCSRVRIEAQFWEGLTLDELLDNNEPDFFMAAVSCGSKDDDEILWLWNNLSSEWEHVLEEFERDYYLQKRGDDQQGEYD